jgi:RimJ/RimL family protein N-acetyltransferase
MDEPLAARRALSDAVVDPLPGGRLPEWRKHSGGTVDLEPLNPTQHAADLYELSHGDQGTPDIWDYLPYGPFPDSSAFDNWLRGCAAAADPMFFVVRDKALGRTAGMASYLNIVPLQGSIEIGHIWFAPAIQATTATTEALYLMMSHAMADLRYRRLEWKCNALNQPSRRAASRLGFRYEGTFYNHVIVKGRNRDTAWYSILDSEWPEIDANFQRWLTPGNFDADGRQRESLSAMNQGRD